MDASALADLIRANQPCVVLTGAGVSTESGIPDFRSPTGIWAEFDPAEYASLPAFRADPEKVWRFYKPRIAMLTEAQPNAAHRALASLERAGLIEAVVTQNIDLLHERAGSREVIEVHGSIRSATCPACRAREPLGRVLELRERVMGCVGLGARQHLDSGRVEAPDLLRVALERAQRRVLHRVDLRPDPGRRAEVRDPALGADAGAGQDDARLPLADQRCEVGGAQPKSASVSRIRTRAVWANTGFVST